MAAQIESAGRRLSATRELDITKYYFYQYPASSGGPGKQQPAESNRRTRLVGGGGGGGSQDEPDVDVSCSPHQSSSSAASSESSPACRRLRLAPGEQQVSECEIVIKSYTRLDEPPPPPISPKTNQMISRARGTQNSLTQPAQATKLQHIQRQASQREQQQLRHPTDITTGWWCHERKPTIEEQLRQLLELEPARERANNPPTCIGLHRLACHHHPTSTSAISVQLQHQLKLMQKAHSCQQHHQQSAGANERVTMNSADRMMIFMLASKRASALQANSLAAKNKRVINWLEDCARATDNLRHDRRALV